MAVLLVSLVGISCVSSKLQNDQAKRVIADQLQVKEKVIEVSSVVEYGNTAVVESVLKTTFVLQRGTDGVWHVVRMQHEADQWETPEEFLKLASPSAFHESLESAFVAALNPAEP